ncbi:MAG: 50S ribosomal protein L25 [bacterium]
MYVRLDAEPRSEFGKGAARRLRRDGRVPAVLYGDDATLVHVSLPGHDLEQALRRPRVTFEIVQTAGTTLAKPRDVQRDPVRRTLEHVDLIIVTESEARARAAESEALIAEAAAAAEAAASAPEFSGSYVTEREVEQAVEGAEAGADAGAADAGSETTDES